MKEKHADTCPCPYHRRMPRNPPKPKSKWSKFIPNKYFAGMLIVCLLLFSAFVYVVTTKDECVNTCNNDTPNACMLLDYQTYIKFNWNDFNSNKYTFYTDSFYATKDNPVIRTWKSDCNTCSEYTSGITLCTMMYCGK